MPVFVQTLYGQNLVDKLRTDVVTKSQDLVNNLTSDATNKALTAAQGKALKAITDTLNSKISSLSFVVTAQDIYTAIKNALTELSTLHPFNNQELGETYKFRFAWTDNDYFFATCMKISSTSVSGIVGNGSYLYVYAYNYSTSAMTVKIATLNNA